MNFLVRLLFVALLLQSIPSIVSAQVVYQDIYKSSVYDFLDEMTNLGFIELNTAVKPYSRALIAQKLQELESEKLNDRQQKELLFFLKDFNKELTSDKNFDKRYDLLYYKDSLFAITVNPIAGFQAWNNENGTEWNRYAGGEFFGSVGKHVGFYASLRDNVSDEISQNESFLNREPGANFKSSGDYSELRGGLTYQWNWGSVGLVKDKLTWGNNNFGANILSDKAPSFTRFELKVKPVKWLELNYYHAWLSSEVRDSSRSYLAGARVRNVDVRKYIAANLFTVTPVKKLNISIGNSIVYSDNFQPAFLIPFFFFKSIDHAIYSGGGNFGGANTQVFLDASSRNIKGLHLYTSLFIDEISFSRMWEEDQHSNFFSWKVGAQKSNLFNKNISLTAEYTRTNPVSFRHFVNTTTYASNEYNLGHYLRDNAQELAFQVQYKPIAKLRVEASYLLAEKGNTYLYSGTDRSVWGLPFMEDIKWKSNTMQLSLNYELLNDLFLFANYERREVSGEEQEFYTYEFYQGETNTFSAGFNVGF